MEPSEPATAGAHHHGCFSQATRRVVQNHQQQV